MTCNHLLVIGEVLSGKTRYVEELLESEDNNYKGHELIWVFHETMSMERREDYHDRFHFAEYSFYPLARAQELKSLMSALMDRCQSDCLRRVVVFDDLQADMAQFDYWMGYFLWHAKTLKMPTISTVRDNYEWDRMKLSCDEMVLFKLNNRRIIDRIVEGTELEKNNLYHLYDSFVLSGLYKHIPLDLRPKRYDVRIRQ